MGNGCIPSSLKRSDATQIGEETMEEIHVLRTSHRWAGIKGEVANGRRSNHAIFTGHKINLEIAKPVRKRSAEDT
ncbi:Hypothetical predicted protein [Podarcis lilfordi]|uniref:Uncharacterized protein n=1 Tax=Podarcis lilfordi TaxID=74358 RepID=A0AA35KG96_9SAUR|nr:Hypothetical predicted protein [Podarcis lilfordi]